LNFQQQKKSTFPTIQIQMLPNKFH
jgi:hypothetical protein